MNPSPHEDRAIGIGLFVRAQGRSEQDALAWMRAEGISDAVAAKGWTSSDARYRGLLRRFARTDLWIGGSVLVLALVIGIATWRQAWGFLGYAAAAALGSLGAYACRDVAPRLRGRPGRKDLRMRAWMQQRYPDLPGDFGGSAV
jgi:hypothetical protein